MCEGKVFPSYWHLSICLGRVGEVRQGEAGWWVGGNGAFSLHGGSEDRNAWSSFPCPGIYSPPACLICNVLIRVTSPIASSQQWLVGVRFVYMVFFFELHSNDVDDWRCTQSHGASSPCLASPLLTAGLCVFPAFLSSVQACCTLAFFTHTPPH